MCPFSCRWRKAIEIQAAIVADTDCIVIAHAPPIGLVQTHRPSRTRGHSAANKATCVSTPRNDTKGPLPRAKASRRDAKGPRHAAKGPRHGKKGSRHDAKASRHAAKESGRHAKGCLHAAKRSGDVATASPRDAKSSPHAATSSTHAATSSPHAVAKSLDTAPRHENENGTGGSSERDDFPIARLVSTNGPGNA